VPPAAPFADRLADAQAATSALCVGLDPDPERLPAHLLRRGDVPAAVLAFNRAVIEATADAACAYKLNFAFYEALGVDGFRVIRDTIAAVPTGRLVIADVKRGDVGHSARQYAAAVFETLRCDACTVAPYMGGDSVRPFLAYPGRAAFVLARTSNAGAADVQERLSDGVPIYRHVADLARAWDAEAAGAAGLVVGATAPAALAELRAACPTLPFLVPGVGAQGGRPDAVMRAAATPEGAVVVNASRSIIYASEGADFAAAAAQAARDARDGLRVGG
jgi:orotidine-5'-phosphate decarboxylase